jgi:hypothetical protein
LCLPDIEDLHRELTPLLEQMLWAEEEIAAAQHRHPEASARIWRAFLALRSTHPWMSTEMVYRAHCRELLERVAHAQDTRPGTAAECCLALAETSLRVPLRTSAVGLYARMWHQGGLTPTALATASSHYEAIAGSRIDELETWLRATLGQSWRVVT